MFRSIKFSPSLFFLITKTWIIRWNLLKIEKSFIIFLLEKVIIEVCIAIEILKLNNLKKYLWWFFQQFWFPGLNKYKQKFDKLFQIFPSEGTRLSYIFTDKLNDQQKTKYILFFWSNSSDLSRILNNDWNANGLFMSTPVVDVERVKIFEASFWAQNTSIWSKRSFLKITVLFFCWRIHWKYFY